MSIPSPFYQFSLCFLFLSNFGFFLPPTLPFAFRTFIMSSEPFFQLPPLCFRSDMFPPLHFPSATLPTPRTLTPDFRLPFRFRFRHSISLPQQFYPKHTLLHFRHCSRSRPATLLLPVTLQFTFLFQTISNFSPACDYRPEWPSRAWP